MDDVLAFRGNAVFVAHQLQKINKVRSKFKFRLATQARQCFPIIGKWKIHISILDHYSGNKMTKMSVWKLDFTALHYSNSKSTDTSPPRVKPLVVEINLLANKKYVKNKHLSVTSQNGRM